MMKLTHHSSSIRLLSRLVIVLAAVLIILGPAPATRGFQSPAKYGQATLNLQAPKRGPRVRSVPAGPVINPGRIQPDAIRLANGKVLFAGGESTSGGETACDLYDPVTNTAAPTGSLATGRSYPRATLLANGKVLLSGGANGSGTLSSAELYDPATGLWSRTGSMLVVRAFHAEVLLPNGKVLVAGGDE